MKLWQTFLWVSVGIAGLGLLGCHHHSSKQSSPEPAANASQPQGQPGYVIVNQAPPAVIVEQRPAPPSDGEYIWVDGYWQWNGNQYVWQSGHWDRPPHEHYTWVAPRYERHEQGYRFTPGVWVDVQLQHRR